MAGVTAAREPNTIGSKFYIVYINKVYTPKNIFYRLIIFILLQQKRENSQKETHKYIV